MTFGVVMASVGAAAAGAAPAADAHYVHGLLIAGSVMLLVGLALGLGIAIWFETARPDPDDASEWQTVRRTGSRSARLTRTDRD